MPFHWTLNFSQSWFSIRKLVSNYIVGHEVYLIRDWSSEIYRIEIKLLWTLKLLHQECDALHKWNLHYKMKMLWYGNDPFFNTFAKNSRWKRHLQCVWKKEIVQKVSHWQIALERCCPVKNCCDTSLLWN